MSNRNQPWIEVGGNAVVVEDHGGHTPENPPVHLGTRKVLLTVQASGRVIRVSLDNGVDFEVAADGTPFIFNEQTGSTTKLLDPESEEAQRAVEYQEMVDLLHAIRVCASQAEQAAERRDVGQALEAHAETHMAVQRFASFQGRNKYAWWTPGAPSMAGVRSARKAH